MEWRGSDVQDQIAARAQQFIYGIYVIETPVPEMLVIPGVFANGKRHLSAIDGDELLGRRGREVAHFVKDVVGGQKHLGLNEFNVAVAQHGR